MTRKFRSQAELLELRRPVARRDRFTAQSVARVRVIRDQRDPAKSVSRVGGRNLPGPATAGRRPQPECLAERDDLTKVIRVVLRDVDECIAHGELRERRKLEGGRDRLIAVSYTHLTLPTILRV